MVEEEIERIKKDMEICYKVSPPEIDIKYSHKSLEGSIFRPMKLEEERLYQELSRAYDAGKRLGLLKDSYDTHSYLVFRTKEELREEIKRELKNYLARQEEELGIKVNPEKYTIVLPTPATIRAENEKGYLEFDQLEHEFEKKKGKGLELKLVRVYKNLYSFLYNHPELDLCAAMWHEMGHILAFLKNIFDDLKNEGIAMLYGFKGLLRDAQEGKFKIDEIKEMMKIQKEKWKMIKIADKAWKRNPKRHTRAFELVLGDFNPDFESLEGAIEDIERRINKCIKEEKRISPFSFIKRLFEN